MRGWLVVLGPAIPGTGPCGLFSAVGRCCTYPGGVFRCCSLFLLAGVWCRFCWPGVCVVRVLWLVLACGGLLVSWSVGLVCVLGSGGLSALRGLLLAWRCCAARGGGLLRGGGLPGGVHRGCVADCCSFGMWRCWSVVHAVGGSVVPCFSWFLCLRGGFAGCCWLCLLWGGVGWRFLCLWGACLSMPPVVWCGLSLKPAVCRWCCGAGLGWLLVLLGAERSDGCACGRGVLLPLAGVGVVAGGVVAPWGGLSILVGVPVPPLAEVW